MADDADLRMHFELLNQELRDRGASAELCVAGGAVITHIFQSEPRSRSVEGLFAPGSLLREAAAAVGAARGLQNRWLSDAVRRFLGRRARSDPFLELSHLKVFSPPPEYLLAMKCAAWRLGEEGAGVEDIRYLLRFLDLTSIEEALDVVRMYFEERQLPEDLVDRLSQFMAPTSM